jgi:sialate O-acetylesterase
MTQATSFPPALRLARIFQDGAVLQRDARIPVWGWAPAEANVSVTLAGKVQNAVADAGGAWLVTFAALPAGGPHTLTVKSGTSELTVRDVMVGDVWIASGQSNMEWPLSRASNGAATVASAHDPLLREFSVPHTFAETPQADLEGGSWSPADSEHAGGFSAVAYFFARDLRHALKIPIGIIHTSWGGANVETWMSRQAQGINDSIWNAITAQGRRREAALRDALRARIGDLPAVDSGLVDGNPAWADITLDDSKWATVPVPLLWERAGYEGLDGVAWYRTTFSLSDAEAYQDIRFALGKIDDDDITWVNGTEIGRTTGYAQTRFYGVPAGVLRAGLNVLAMRVADWGGGGGIYGDSSQVFMEIGSTRRSFPRNWKFKVGVASFGTDAQRINKVPSLLYNRMIYPLLRYPIKGAIWYQGESNANNDEQARAYRPLFAKLIESWRREWQGSASDFPFLWVQLPNYGPIDTVPPVTAGWAILRESQTAAVRLPNTGQVITIDVGGANELHPPNKEPVGQRLALIARRVAYGENILASGPRYQRHRISNGKVVIEFDDVGGGLVSGTPDMRGFAIAGADRRWVWANARIEGNSVVVSSPQVTNPVAVRYAWGNSPNNPSLYNREGLPAAPFRTDVW